LRVFITISDPKLRRTAELALEFVTRSYKDEALEGLEYVFVTSAYSPSDREEVAKIAERVLSKGSLALEAVGLVVKEVTHGAYAWREPKAVAVAMRIGAWGLRVLAHEFAHHALRPDLDGLLAALRTELLEVDELAARSHASGNEEVIKRAEEVRDALARYADEMSAEYVTANYFVLLNTRPVLDVVKARRVAFFDHFTDILQDVEVRLVRLSETLGEEVEAGRLDKEVADALADLSRSLIRRLYRGRLHGRKFLDALHSIVSAKLKAWPKEVYMTDPRRYEVVLGMPDAEGLKLFREYLRERGVPFME